MAASSLLARLGLRIATMGSLASLAYAAPAVEGDVGQNNHTRAGRTGWYHPTAESTGFVTNGVERLRLFDDGGAQLGGAFGISPGVDNLLLAAGKITSTAKVDASLGAEVITLAADRDFSADSGNWTGVNWSIGANVFTHVAGANAAALAGYDASIGTTYQIIISVNTFVAGELTIEYGGASTFMIGQTVGGLTSYTVLITATAVSGLVLFPDASWEGTVDNVSIKAITPNTASAEHRNATSVLGCEIRGVNTSSFGVGVDALRYNITGTDNTAVGAAALMSTVDGYSNTSVGSRSLQNNTTGYENVAIGVDTMFANTVGWGNVALGVEALLANIGGAYNVAIGYDALYDNLSGSYNVSVGTSTLLSNITGNLNVAVGRDALRNNEIGSNNVAIGMRAQHDNYDGNENIGIGTEPLHTNTSGGFNIAVGKYALYSVQGSDNIAFGQEAAASLDGSGNVAIGKSAGYSLVAGDNNVFVGALAGFDVGQLVNASNSIAIGPGAFTTVSNQAVFGASTITQTLLRGCVTVGTSENHAITEVIADTNLGDTHYTILVDATAGAVVISLPDSTVTLNIAGRVYNVKKIDATANPVTVQRVGASDLIDGATTNVLTVQYQSRTYQCRPTSPAANRWSVI